VARQRLGSGAPRRLAPHGAEGAPAERLRRGSGRGGRGRARTVVRPDRQVARSLADELRCAVDARVVHTALGDGQHLLPAGGLAAELQHPGGGCSPPRAPGCTHLVRVRLVQADVDAGRALARRSSHGQFRLRAPLMYLRAANPSVLARCKVRLRDSQAPDARRQRQVWGWRDLAHVNLKGRCTRGQQRRKECAGVAVHWHVVEPGLSGAA
jgi:hypothetical protein